MVAEGNPYKYTALRASGIRKRDNRRLDNSTRIASLIGAAVRQKKSDRMSEKHPAAIQFGVPPSKPRNGGARGDSASEHTHIFLARKGQYCECIRNRKIMRNN